MRVLLERSKTGSREKGRNMRRTILGALLLLGCNSGGADDGLGGGGPDDGTGGNAGAGSGGATSSVDCVKPEEMIPVGCAIPRPDLGECVLVAKDEDEDGFPGECEVPVTPGVTFLRNAKDPSKAWDCDDKRSSVNPEAWDGPPIPGRPNGCNDDLNNDCSGTVDDGADEYEGQRFTCTCSESDPRLACRETSQGTRIDFPGGGRPKGECRWGARLCDDGRWEECNGAVGPRPETCAQYLAHPNKDYDCDGKSAAEELEDPEDGVVDTRLFYCDADGDGRLANDRESVLSVLACAPPETGCGPDDGGTWIEKPQSSAFADCDDEDPDVGGKNRTEICDGKDNDCDESVDEDVTFDNQLATFECGPNGPRILSCPAGKLFCDEDVLGNGCETDVDLDNCYECDTACSFACSAITKACSEITEFALGGLFSCATMEDGRMACFGEGSSGQLGDGTSQDRTSPVLTQDLQGPLEIDAGESHVCAIGADSHIYCWGEGADGQLSSFQGGDLAKPDPTFAIDLEELTGAPAASLGLGIAHSCAITTDHGLHCWGRGTAGQLGDGGFESHAPPSFAYKLLTNDYAPFDDAAEVTAGVAHTCARTVGGLVYCAGDSSYGQLGVAEPTEQGLFEKVALLTQVTSISAGTNHTCAVQTGQVYCWGRNDNGQIGKPNVVNVLTPEPIAGISSALLVRSGSGFSCALLEDGTVSCWGSNADGQLGPSGPPQGTSPSPVTVDGLTAVVSLETGGGHVCAIQANHDVSCWGRNSAGQLGRGATSAGSPAAMAPKELSVSPL